LADYRAKDLPTSSLSFGSWDLGKYALESDFTYLYLVDQSGYWVVRSYGFRVNHRQDVTTVKEKSVPSHLFYSCLKRPFSYTAPQCVQSFPAILGKRVFCLTVQTERRASLTSPSY